MKKYLIQTGQIDLAQKDYLLIEDDNDLETCEKCYYDLNELNKKDFDYEDKAGKIKKCLSPIFFHPHINTAKRGDQGREKRPDFVLIWSRLLHSNGQIDKRELETILGKSYYSYLGGAGQRNVQLKLHLANKALLDIDKKFLTINGSIWKMPSNGVGTFFDSLNQAEETPENIGLTSNKVVVEELYKFVNSKQKVCYVIAKDGDGKTFYTSRFAAGFRRKNKNERIFDGLLGTCFVTDRIKTKRDVLVKLLTSILSSDNEGDYKEVFFLLCMANEADVSKGFEETIINIGESLLEHILFYLLKLMDRPIIFLVDGLPLADFDENSSLRGFFQKVASDIPEAKLIITMKEHPEWEEESILIDLSDMPEHRREIQKFCDEQPEFEPIREEIKKRIAEGMPFVFFKDLLKRILQERGSSEKIVPDSLNALYKERCEKYPAVADAGMLAAVLRTYGFKSITADTIMNLNRIAINTLQKQSGEMLYIDKDYHIRVNDSAYDFFAELNREDKSAQNVFRDFCVNLINSNYKSIDVEDLLRIRDYYIYSLRNTDVKTFNQSALVEFEIYCTIDLWNQYLCSFEREGRNTDFWVEKTNQLFDHISREYIKLPSEDQSRLKNMLAAANLRRAYGLYYQGKIQESVELVSEIREIEAESYASDFRFRYEVDEAFIWWQKEINPEQSLKACDDFLRFAKDKGLSLEDAEVATISFYRCVAKFRIVRNNGNLGLDQLVTETEELLNKLGGTRMFSEASNELTYNKVRLLLAQMLCRLCKYKEAERLAENDLESRRAKCGNAFFTIHGMNTLGRIYTYHYRDALPTEDLDVLFERARAVLTDAYRRIHGQIKSGESELLLAQLYRFRYDKFKDKRDLAAAFQYLKSARDRYLNLGGENHTDYNYAVDQIKILDETYGNVL